MDKKIYYHYCSLDSLLGILEKQSIWLSSATTMNDHSECSWGTHVLSLMLKEHKENDHGNYSDKEQMQIENLSRFHSYLKGAGNFNTNYIFSMSKKKDSLSQWRAYGDDGKGVAIGFNCSSFTNETSNDKKDFRSPRLQEVKYLCREDMISQIENLYSSVMREERNHSRYALFSNQMEQLNVQYKNKSFEEENEFRFILKLANNNIFEPLDKGWVKDNVKLRVSYNNLISYYEYKLCQLFKKEAPISEIVLGPRSKVSEVDLKLLLYRHSLQSAKISRSSATYH